jgi:hypothetical protein
MSEYKRWCAFKTNFVFSVDIFPDELRTVYYKHRSTVEIQAKIEHSKYVGGQLISYAAGCVKFKLLIVIRFMPRGTAYRNHIL